MHDPFRIILYDEETEKIDCLTYKNKLYVRKK